MSFEEQIEFMKMSEHQLPRNKVYKSHKPINKCHNKVPQAILVDRSVQKKGEMAAETSYLMHSFVINWRGTISRRNQSLFRFR